jgi:hypothetical protein
MKQYVLNQNFPHRTINIHSEDCNYANGEGIDAKMRINLGRQKNIQWHGFFDSREEAILRANEISSKSSREINISPYCILCNPNPNKL